MLRANSAPAVSTITLPAGMSGSSADIAAPTSAEIAPNRADTTSMCPSFSVQNRDAAGGITSSAITMISPTACSPATTTITTSPISIRSIRETGHPLTRANASLKQTMHSSFLSVSVMSSAASAIAPMSVASPVFIAAACPAYSLANDSTYYGLEDDIITERFEIRNGKMTVPKKPGLGIEADAEKLRRYQIE